MSTGTRQHAIRTRLLLVFGTVAFVAVAGAIIGGYMFGWAWTGVGASTEITDATRSTETTRTVKQVGAKTLWDWMQLLAALLVPVVIALAGYRFTRQQSELEAHRIKERAELEQQRAEERAELEQHRAEERAAFEQQRTEETYREAALQAYLNQMADLLLKGLRSSKPDAELRDIARIRTLTTLRRLDSARCTMVFRFLHDAKLVSNTADTIINLQRADLSNQDLEGTYVGPVDLQQANLRKANLAWVILDGTNLNEVNLQEANLYRAKLNGASLQEANLQGANFGEADFRGVNLGEPDFRGVSLDGADFRGVSLYRAKLDGASLQEANLQGAFLYSASLCGAKLNGANLQQTNLRGASVTQEQLMTCKTLKGAILPDGTTVPDDQDFPPGWK